MARKRHLSYLVNEFVDSTCFARDSVLRRHYPAAVDSSLYGRAASRSAEIIPASGMAVRNCSCFSSHGEAEPDAAIDFRSMAK